MLKIEILYAHEKSKASILENLLSQWISENPQNNAFVYLLFSLCKRGFHVTRAITILENAIRGNEGRPESLGITLAIADLYLLRNQRHAAVERYEKVLSQTKNETFKDELSKKIKHLKQDYVR